MVQLSEMVWAKSMFGAALLGDQRRTDRLVLCAALQARDAGASSLATCGGDSAAAEGLYRLMSNEGFETTSITDAGCLATIAAAPKVGDILAIQDDTALSFPARLKPELGPIGGKNSAKTNGIMVHSTLLVDLNSGDTIGLAHQQFWVRDPTEPRRQAQAADRASELKESFKWQQADAVVLRRFAAEAHRIIAVADRESDITEWMAKKVAAGERFVFRSLHNRVLDGPQRKLRKAVAAMPVVSRLTVHVPQRGGKQARPVRTAIVSLRVGTVRLAPTELPEAQRFKVNVLWVHEDHPPPGEDALDWLLLTSEPVETAAAAERVLRCYRLRWRIEDFHKAWKSEGCDIEGRRQRSADTLERTAAMLAFVAVRLLQLRDAHDRGSTAACTTLLTPLQWRCLWQATEKTKVLPKKAPDATWACRALAKLGGWMPKKGASPGYAKLWRGWDKLSERVEAVQLAFGLAGQEM